MNRLASEEPDRRAAYEPADARACQALAAELHRSGRTDEAVHWLRRAAELEPGSAALRSNLAAALGMLGRHGEAERELREAVRLAPNSAQARNNLGVALEHLERYPEAVESLREAVRLSPGDARAWANLSNTLRKNWQAGEALEAALRSAGLDRGYAEAHNAAGAALMELGRLDEAAGAFARAIEVMPGHAEARVNGAMALLSRGDWVNGFRGFECRFGHPVWRRKLPGRRWAAPAVGSGERAAAPLPKGSTVLLYGEGGLGNAIQFARFATRVAEMGVRVIIECRAELAPLLRTVPGVAEVVGCDPQFTGNSCAHGTRPASGAAKRGEQDRRVAYDCYAALMSLPALLGIDQMNAVTRGPSLTAEADRVRKWGEFLKGRGESASKLGGYTKREAGGGRGRGVLVGVSWQGEQTPAFRRNRSFPVGQLARLASIPGVRLVSLQKNCTFDRSFPMIEIPELDECGGAFLDTAAIMTHMDLVVTCDTSIAHLAGAMGKATWVALPFAADWRWMRSGGDTPWYRSLRLFRQASAGDWEWVFGEIISSLEELAGGHEL